MKIAKLLPLLGLVLLAGCNKVSTPTEAAKPAEKPVAVVNGTPISREFFNYYVKNAAGKTAGDLTADQRSQLLDNLIRGEVIAQQAEKDGLDKNGDTAALLMLSRLQILEQADAEQYLKDKKPTDAERQAEYDAQVAAMPKTQYHARHILVKTQEEAQKIPGQHGETVLGGRGSAEEGRNHAEPGAVTVRLARDPAHRHARNPGAAARLGQGPRRSAGAEQEVQGLSG
jgi:hypothetical protein